MDDDSIAVLRWPVLAIVLADAGLGLGLAFGFGLVYGPCAPPPGCLDPEVLCPAVCRNAWASFAPIFVLGALYGLLPAVAVGFALAIKARVRSADRPARALRPFAVPAAVLALLCGVLLLYGLEPLFPVPVYSWAALIGGTFVLGVGLPVVWKWSRPGGAPA